MVNFTRLTPAFEAAQTQAQRLICKLGPNSGQVCGTVGIKDISKLKFNDILDAVRNIDNVVVKELPSGNKMVRLSGCSHINSQDPYMNVVLTFNREGDCLMLSGGGRAGGTTKGFSLRTQEGIDRLIDAGLENPGSRVYTNISHPYVARGQKIEGQRWYFENSGTPSQDILEQPYEYPHTYFKNGSNL